MLSGRCIRINISKKKGQKPDEIKNKNKNLKLTVFTMK
jgi:hypothetical protein